MINRYKGRAGVMDLCEWAAVPKSSFHYKAHPGPRGMKPSTHTLHQGIAVSNAQVVEQIRSILTMDYCVYGYRIMTTELRTMEYHINHKKVYSLMKANRLLCGKVIRTQGKRQWVKHRRIEATKPMEYICLDIKYVWVQGDRRWYYQLAIMDVFSRRILCWIFQRSVKQQDVIVLMRSLDIRFGLKGVVIRNDNGSQFIAQRVRQALQEMEARQEFTHVATPEENAYIEAFHSIQQRELMDRYEFDSFYHAQQHIRNYMHWYNCKRRHGQLCGLRPMEKWAQGMFRSADRQLFVPGSTALSRPDDRAMRVASAMYSLDKPGEPAYLRLTGERDDYSENELVANYFRENVQLIGG